MKRYIIVLVCCLSVSGLFAQEMKDVFVNMPDQYIPQLESAWRKDLIDLYTSGKTARLQNTMDGYSRLDSLTDDYLLLQVTERSSVEMKMLPLVNNTYVICMVTTISGPVSDSRIDFYSTDWKPLPTADLFTPVSLVWFLNEDVDCNAYDDAKARLDMDLITYKLSPDKPTLTASYTTPSYLDKKAKEKVLSVLKDYPKVYTWEKSHFK